jgi:hypothetical protein
MLKWFSPVMLLLIVNTPGVENSNVPSLRLPLSKDASEFFSRLTHRREKNSDLRDIPGSDRVLLIACAEASAEAPNQQGLDLFLNRVPQLKQFESGVKNAFSQVSEVRPTRRKLLVFS